jgi:hypothetical protein
VLSSSSSEAGGVRPLFIRSLVWRSRPRTEREGVVGVVGLSLSVFTGSLSFAVGLLEFCTKQLESVAIQYVQRRFDSFLLTSRR